MLMDLFVFTNNRPAMVTPLVKGLAECQRACRISVFNSGPEHHCFEELSRLNNVTVFKTEAKTLGLNMLTAIDMMSGRPAFYLHDDDEVDSKRLAKIVNHVVTNDVELALSLRLNLGNSHVPMGMSQQVSKSDVISAYFGDARDNCPMISGFYVRSGGLLKQELLKSDPTNKYGDVQLIAELANAVESVTVDHYIRYREHAGNDNATRCLRSRILLSEYIASLGGLKNLAISKLVFYGYKGKRLEFILGVILMLASPELCVVYARKLFRRLSTRYSSKDEQ
jgi:hypothetical protein